MSRAATLRALLRSGRMILAPGAIDGITARAVERAGFSALYMTGAGTSATLGYPDYGLLTMTEMVANAARIVNSTTIPLISDADTGYGNELNVYRTVQEFERVGVAAIHIEDQAFPKRCGHLDNKEVTSREGFIAKIRAAAAARRSADFVVIARTDSRAVLGFDEAVARANLALANGADIAFVEAPQSMDEVAKIPQRVKGPCLLNVVQGGKTPGIVMNDAERMGYAVAIIPGLLLMSIVDVCDAALEDFKQTGVHPKSKARASPASFFARFGAADWDARRTAFRDPIGDPISEPASEPKSEPPGQAVPAAADLGVAAK